MDLSKTRGVKVSMKIARHVRLRFMIANPKKTLIQIPAGFELQVHIGCNEIGTTTFAWRR
jgi:hypothetical protein